MKTELFFLLMIICSVYALPYAEHELIEDLRGGIKSGVKGVKGRVANATHFYGFGHTNNRNLTGSSYTVNNSLPRDYEKGVCYVEVPTISLAKDLRNVPVGNGSDPTMSKIRKCCPGYTKNIHNFRICDPVCEHECVNAKCIAPNVCSCFPDHVLDLDGWCVPTCPIGCLNGVCGPDNECVCRNGFIEEPKMKFCMPRCSKGCLKGNCTAPEVCTCESGHEYDGEGVCRPKCDNGCFYGNCVAPNECACHSGYTKNVQGKCEPVCSRGCPQGTCIAPETCSCSVGYVLDPSSSRCIPHCVQPCENGQCTAPNTCTCHPGYALNPRTNRCEPHCDQPCQNGDCTGPNTCNCHPGFTKDSRDIFRCVRPGPSGASDMCPNGCPNGICSGPNLCLCNVGYVKDRSVKGSQRCVQRVRRQAAEHLLKFMIE